MANLQINGTQATQITGPLAGVSGFTIQNAPSGEIVYFSSSTGVSNNNYGYYLQPGQSLYWPEDTPCFAICDPGNSTSISFESTAAGITSATIGGTVAVSGGQINNSPGSVPLLLDYEPLQVPITAGANILYANNYDPTIFSSVLILFAFLSGNIGVVGNYLEITVSQYINGNLTVSVYTPQWLLDSGGFGSIQVPVVGSLLAIAVNYSKGATSTPNGIAIYVIGSHEVIAQAKYVNATSTMNGTLHQGGEAVVASGNPGTVSTFVASKNGPVSLFVIAATGTSAGGSDVEYAENGALASIIGGGAIATGGFYQQTINLPMRPIQLIARTTASSLTAALT